MAGPGYAGAKTWPQKPGFVALTSAARHLHRQANAPTKLEQSVSRLAIALFVVGNVALIAGLIEGSNVLVPVLIVGASILCLFIMSRILAVREKKARKKPSNTPTKNEL